MDRTRGYESLDTELQQIVRDAALAPAWRTSSCEFGGGIVEQVVLVHTEIQGTREADFAKRIYVYNYRLFDRYDRPVVSLAVLGDASPTWRPTRYEQSLWGCRVGIEFPVVKLRDYATRWEALEASDNLLATVVMAHLQARATRRDPEGRLQGKLRLIRRLYERGYARQDVLELLRFIDWVLTLPAGLKLACRRSWYS